MGVRNLNKYLIKNCPKSIKTIHLKELSGKIIVVDASIYIYKFLADDALMEHMYLLISILMNYNIEPIFVFDGKPPVEKNNTICKRKENKKNANIELLEIEDAYKNEQNIKRKKEILFKIKLLKRQTVSVTKKHILNVKELMDAYGIQYIVSICEADLLCAHLIENNKAWGCLSDDTDMFVYNCNYVLRDINILHHTVNLYDTQNILKEININESDFNEILIISTSEYSHNIDIPISQVIQLYRKYKKELYKHGFYVWLLKTTNYIKDYKELLNVYRIYKTTYTNTSITVNKGKKDINKIKSIMVNDGFIFV